ncbi:unnamed protein product [Phyllotreta striolata]|uniref:Myeloid differentiation primary response protein MyD88 n=1 Tax=Phyllotreta striolata TaxID=444603 RepID=A0A9N9TQX6_PHYSR|nr:unnamed protein product [Phyllotreta striolata]
MYDISVVYMRKETTELISALLNPKKVIPNENGLSRDWHGLAELCGIGGEKIPNIERSNDPTLKVIEIWSEKDRNNSTIKKFISFLETLDRFDIIDDITPLLEKDVDYFRANPNGFTASLQDFDDKDIITYDDAERKKAGLPPEMYDAFVLFDDDDIDFATEIIKTMEGQYNLKLCVKDRDVVGGESNHDSVIRVISTRCHRVIVVVSPAFLESSINKYFYTLASMDGIERQRRKIIPCLYKKIENLPIEFKAFHFLDYTRSEIVFGSFWDQLYKSLKVISPPTPSNQTLTVTVQNSKRIQHNVDPFKSSNHVKFALLDSQPKEAEPDAESTKIVNNSNSVSSPSVVATGKELKKNKSLLNKCRNFLHKKIENKKTEVKTEVPEINGLTLTKKKTFWKSRKLKVEVTN